MNAKHTLGPWEYVKGKRAGSDIFAILAPKADVTIATTDQWDKYYAAEEEANARLIAAAPELAEALRDALRALSCLDAKTRQNLELTIETARAVLAKLQGGVE